MSQQFWMRVHEVSPFHHEVTLWGIAAICIGIAALAALAAASFIVSFTTR